MVAGGRRSVVMGVRKRRVEAGGRRRCALMAGCSSRVESCGGEDGGAVVGMGGAAGAGLLQVGVGGAVEVRSRRRLWFGN